MPAYEIHGHSIISDDDCIADARGVTPPELRNEADWTRFQAELDKAAVIVLGRRGHEINPNHRGRNRLVVSSRAIGVEWRSDAWWWNPAEASLREALKKAAPTGGLVAVPGGRLVNDLFLDLGFDAYHLVRKRGVFLPGGVKIFTRVGHAGSTEALLRRHGLHPSQPVQLDAAERVSLTIWER